MRASELLASRVVDADGRDLGPVRDVRVRREIDGAWRVTGIVVGDGRFAGAAHALGVAEGRVQGPWLLRRLCAQAVERARRVPATDVREWGPEVVTLRVAAGSLQSLNRGAS